jgi:hypothetical protein
MQIRWFLRQLYVLLDSPHHAIYLTGGIMAPVVLIFVLNTTSSGSLSEGALIAASATTDPGASN